jgi:hypothetical protein
VGIVVREPVGQGSGPVKRVKDEKHQLSGVAHAPNRAAPMNFGFGRSRATVAT